MMKSRFMIGEKGMKLIRIILLISVFIGAIKYFVPDGVSKKDVPEELFSQQVYETTYVLEK